MEKASRRRDVPEAVAWKRTDMVFGDSASLIAGGLSMAVMGGMIYAQTGAAWMLGWSAAVLLLTAARLRLAAAYRRRRPEDTPSRWARLFTLGACANGALWGIASLVIITEDDPLAHMLVVSVQSGFLASAAARNSPVPAATLGGALLARVPMVFACLANGGPFYLAFAAIVVLHVLGAMSLARSLSAQTVALLLSNHERARLVAEVGRANEELAAANARLEALARTDGLTGLLNRRGFDGALEMEWRRSLRDARPIALLLVDIDRFKLFNDSLGHPAGDACLRVVAQTLAQALRRPGEIAARYGGEEMAVILPDTDAAGAMRVAERIRAAVEALAIPHPHGFGGRLTVSVGCVSRIPQSWTPLDALVAGADAALYASKRGGRNRAELAEATA